MEIIKIEKEAFVLDKEEKEKLIACLLYCKHRLEKHDSGLEHLKGGLAFVLYMIEQLIKKED